MEFKLGIKNKHTFIHAITLDHFADRWIYRRRKSKVEKSPG